MLKNSGQTVRGRQSRGHSPLRPLLVALCAELISFFFKHLCVNKLLANFFQNYMRRQHKRYSVMYPQNSRPSGISRRALKWGENREVRRLTTPEPGGPGFTPLSVSNAPDKRRYRPADSFWEMKRRCASNLGRVLCLCGSLLPVLDGRVLELATCALARGDQGSGGRPGPGASAQLVQLLTGHGRRPLSRHTPDFV